MSLYLSPCLSDTYVGVSQPFAFTIFGGLRLPFSPQSLVMPLRDVFYAPLQCRACPLCSWGVGWKRGGRLFSEELAPSVGRSAGRPALGASYCEVRAIPEVTGLGGTRWSCARIEFW